MRANYALPMGGIVTPIYPGVIDGPVEVNSPDANLLSTQRVIFNGNFTETPSVREDALASDYYLSWYDEVSAGMRSWILIGNQGSVSTTAQVFIGGALRGSFSIPPGGRVTPEFPGVLAGPVRVVSTNGQPLIVSERVTYNGSFNEITGTPAASLSNEHRLAWYDFQSPGLRTWVLVANPNPTPVTAEIYIGGVLRGTNSLPPGGIWTPVFPGILGGPVRVRSTGGQNLIVSERSTYGNSFEEVAGVPPSALTDGAWFTWYDQVSAGLKTWILMSNQGTAPTTADIFIAGSHVAGPFNLPAGGAVTVANFPGILNGPVRVISGGQPILVSERTIYNASFNEITGLNP